MAWIEKKKNWFPGGGKKRPSRQEMPQTYSVAEVAGLLSVTKQTVYKWLLEDEDGGEAVIPEEGWFKLQGSGQIRIYKWAVEKLYG